MNESEKKSKSSLISFLRLKRNAKISGWPNNGQSNKGLRSFYFTSRVMNSGSTKSAAGNLEHR